MIELVPPTIAYNNGWVALHLDAALLEPSVVQLGGEDWFAKEELHCSLVAVNTLAAQIASETMRPQDEAETKMLTSVAAFLRRHTFRQKGIELTDDFRIVRRLAPDGQSERSIIRMVGLPEVDSLFAALSRDMYFSMPVQPTHVTLYTGPNRRGIGLSSEKELARYSVPMPDMGKAELCRITNIGEVLA